MSPIGVLNHGHLREPAKSSKLPVSLGRHQQKCCSNPQIRCIVWAVCGQGQIAMAALSAITSGQGRREATPVFARCWC
jgi:hypothetical protein